jgi:hypothetical protein
MALSDAIQHYHDLLTDDLGGETQAQLTLQQGRRGLFFGQRPLCTVLRPRLMTPEQYRSLQQRMHVVLGAFDKAFHRALEDDAFRRQFGLLDWEEELIRLDTGFDRPSPTARMDAFMTDDGGLHLIEYNAEVPAAVAYSDVLSEVFYGLPVMREFLRTYDVRSLPSRHNVLHVLLDAYRSWSGRPDPPRIAILDWREVPTFSEFELFEQYFQAQGIECAIVDPRDVEYRHGSLRAHGFSFDLIYKRVLASELIAWGGIDQPIVRALRDHAACMVNGFRCKILHKKASFAVLSDERNADLFDPAERRAIAEHIPWTRRVEDRYTEYAGQKVDLLQFAADQRERLVLKSNDEYGGKGIVLGWRADADEWRQALQAALEEPHVIQERVPVASELYPRFIEGKVELGDTMLDTDPFIFHGSYVDGCLTRLSTEALLNVTAGGGSTVPTFVVERR